MQFDVKYLLTYKTDYNALTVYIVCLYIQTSNGCQSSTCDTIMVNSITQTTQTKELKSPSSLFLRRQFCMCCETHLTWGVLLS